MPESNIPTYEEYLETFGIKNEQEKKEEKKEEKIEPERELTYEEIIELKDAELEMEWD